jgi:arylsulfatase A-like enzyme
MAGGLMYLIRQFDLIPDYLKPVGLLDDAIVLRVTADLGAEHTAELDPKYMKQMFKLANDAEVVKEFLGDSYRDLENYVRRQPEDAVHGITGDSVVEHASVRDELLTQVNEEMKAFEANAIEDGAKVERELKSYIHAKLDEKK